VAAVSVGEATKPIERSAIDAPAALILAAGLAARLICILGEFDRDWEHDPYNHVIFAQSVFADLPGSLAYGIPVWAKPLYTFFFALLYQLLPTTMPALVTTQIANSLLWTASAWLVLLVARDIFRHRQTILLLAVICAFTFIGFRSSISANTEPSAAFIVALGLWLWHRRQMLAASLCFGLVVLARTDGVFCVSVFALAAVIEPIWERRRNGVTAALLRGAVFALPTALWNLAGFLRTGSPLFIVSNGYPTALGIYGHGEPQEYLLTFLAFDTVLATAFAAGAFRVLRHPRDSRPMLVVCAAMGVAYFIVMSAMWSLGAFGSAGYVRYFVFAYPIYILVAGAALDRLFAWLSETGRAARNNGVATALSLTVLLQLHWFAHGIVWIYNNNTRIPASDLARLRDLPIDWDGKAVYADHPEVAYYLGHDRLYLDRHPLSEIRNPAAHGIFIFVRAWSEGYSPDITAADFAGLTLLATLAGPYREVAYVYER
jgi:hypothetical protein